MDVPRILRVLITIVLVLSLFVVVIAAYRHELMVNSIVELSDSTSSIITRLSTNELAWKDSNGNKHEYVLDPELLDDHSYFWVLGGENYASQVIIAYGNGPENEIGPFGHNPPSDRMTSALAVPVALQRGGRPIPAQLRVIVWNA